MFILNAKSSWFMWREWVLKLTKKYRKYYSGKPKSQSKETKGQELHGSTCILRDSVIQREGAPKSCNGKN